MNYPLFIQDLIENGSRYNMELVRAYSDNENIKQIQSMAQLLGINNEKAITTNCIITAMMIRQCLIGTIEEYDTIQVDSRNYQIFFYSDENYVDLEHVVTIIDHWIIQSFYNKYTIKVDKIDIDLSDIRKMDGISLWKLMVSPICNHDCLFIEMKHLPSFELVIN